MTAVLSHSWAAPDLSAAVFEDLPDDAVAEHDPYRVPYVQHLQLVQSSDVRLRRLLFDSPFRCHDADNDPDLVSQACTRS